MKALVVGACGLIGRELMRTLVQTGHIAIGTSRKALTPQVIELDAANTAMMQTILEVERPDWVFYTAGWSWVDACEGDPAKTMLQNVDIPANVAMIGHRIGAGFTYFSTDYIFDGVHGPYTECATPNPLNVYGRAKLKAEQRLLAMQGQTLIVRTTGVYGVELGRKNFVCQLLDRAARGEKMVVPIDQVSTPTYAPDLAAACVECAERRIIGILNLVGQDCLSRYAFAMEACRVLDLDPVVLIPRRTDEIGQVARRPLNAGLVNTRSRQLLSTSLHGVTEGLRATRTVIAEQNEHRVDV